MTLFSFLSPFFRAVCAKVQAAFLHIKMKGCGEDDLERPVLLP